MFINSASRHIFWSRVTTCLSEFHGWTYVEAQKICERARVELEYSPFITPKTLDRIYSVSPFEYACEIADAVLAVSASLQLTA